MPLVNITFVDKIATISMANGKANPLCYSMLDELNAALTQAEEAEATIILTSESSIFCAGYKLDIVMNSPEERAKIFKVGFTLCRRLLAYPFPVVVAVTGHSLAMGALIMMSSDYTIGVEGKFKLGLNETAIGVSMPFAGCDITRARLPNRFLNQVVLQAELQNPQGALDKGLIDQLVNPENLMKMALEKAEQLSQLNPQAYTNNKLNLREQLLADMDRSIERDFKIVSTTPL